MTQWSKDLPEALERLSEMVDGEAESTSVERLCTAWRNEPAARATWHAYHLIGDVLRSGDLSSDVRRDAAFLRALRERLATEPVVLAPAAPQARAPAEPSTAHQRGQGGRRPWFASAWTGAAAVAAGFVAVAGVLLVTQTPVPAPVPAPVFALSPDAATVRAASASGEAAAEPQNVVANGKVIRDARLEQYLAAHKQFGGSSALGVPSGFLRSATVEVPNR
jgi:sigma-E factor negative regulatory protein RseA